MWSPAVGVLVGVSNGVMSDAASLNPLLDVVNGVAVADVASVWTGKVVVGQRKEGLIPASGGGGWLSTVA